MARAEAGSAPVVERDAANDRAGGLASENYADDKRGELERRRWRGRCAR